jgi:C4-dicarboxylate-specific signal transduction histidine kinase
MDWLARYTRRSFLTQLIVTFVALVLVTAVAVGLPAYYIISSALEKQAWERIEDAERITRVALEAELARLASVAQLAAGRPSLQQLVRASDLTALAEYLETFRSSVALDLLAVCEPSGRVLASSGTLEIEPLYSEAVGFRVDSDNRLVLTASQAILDDQSAGVAGYWWLA